MEELRPSFGACPQCGKHHPPIPAGQRCPMAKEINAVGKEIDFSKFFVNLKNVLSSKIREKNIENTDKFFGELIVNIYKFIETYKESK